MRSAAARLLGIAVAAIAVTGCVALSVTADELDRIRDVAERVVPWETPVEVRTRETGPGKAALSISVHLIPGYPPGSPATTIPRELGTTAALTAYAEERAAEVYREVLSRVEVPDVSGVNVEIRHGVEQYIGNRSQSRVVSVPIYEVQIPASKARGKDWANLSTPNIRHLWKVETNLIPELGFE